MSAPAVTCSRHEATEQVSAFVEANRAALIDLCARLVAGRSVNPPGRTVEAVAAVAGFLAERGISCESLGRTPEKPNIVVQCRGQGAGRHLVFNGHLDTISPGDERDWSVPLYDMTRRQGRLYGIGMGNMKGAVAALTLAFVYLAQHRDLWCGTLSFSAVADETVFGPDGAAWLLEQRPDLVGDALICGEGPGDMELAIAEKGVLWLRAVANAPSGQGMLASRGSSAVVRLATALLALDGMNDEVATPPPELTCLEKHAGAHGLRISVNAGTISGGRFVSQVATEAMAEIDIRVPPGLTVDALQARVDSLTARIPGLAFSRIKGWDPNWTDPDEPVVACVREAAARIRPRPPRPVVRLPASDASRWRARGTPAVCFGPQPTQASGIDDFAYEQDVVDCAKIYADAALTYLNGATQ